MTGFVGGIIKGYESNFLHTGNDWVVVEADEYDRSFLRLFPTIAIIQAMDADHLDVYGDRRTEPLGRLIYRVCTIYIIPLQP